MPSSSKYFSLLLYLTARLDIIHSDIGLILHWFSIKRLCLTLSDDGHIGFMGQMLLESDSNIIFAILVVDLAEKLYFCVIIGALV